MHRCCGNCEWSISPECEDDILREQGYEEDDSARPKAGDCCLGIEHDGKFVCENHKYIENGINTSIFYDSKYLGPGYFIVTQYYDEIIRFMKIYRSGTYGNFSYGIRGYEINPFTDSKVKDIEFKLSYYDNKELFSAINSLAVILDNNVIKSLNNSDKSTLSSEIYKYSAFLALTKNIQGVENSSNFIDVNIGSVIDNNGYEEISLLFRNLAKITKNMTDSATMKKILKMIK